MVEDIDPNFCPTTDNGIPMLGLGTWRNDDPNQCAQSVQTALEMGYRHIDTAQIYKNEAAVGNGLVQSDVDREDVFLATKVWTDNLGYDDVHETARESLDHLGVDSADLLYVHWPADAYEPEETLRAFSELYDDGRIENVGVSNFMADDLEWALDVCDAPIVANQVELHPMLPQDDLREACHNYNVDLVAYSPLARGAVFDQPEIQDVAAAHDVSEVQVSLAWLREKGVTAIPKATGEKHIADNWDSLTVELTRDDIDTIDAIDEISREVDPDFAPWN